MSVISEQVNKLKDIQNRLETDGELDMDILQIAKFWAKDIRDAIDTIETLSIIVQANNLHNGWIPFSKLRPEQCDKYKGKKVIDILVTTDKGKVTKVQYIHARSYNGDFADYWYCGRIYGDTVAWQPLPEPYEITK